MKILVYDDNPDFGGHQLMAAYGIEALASDSSHEIVCMFNPLSTQWNERLPGFQSLELSTDFQSLKIDLALCIQGDIAQSTRGIQRAKKAGIECVSYLALPHTMARMGARLGGLRDLTKHHLVDAPDRYITISGSMKKLLMERGCTKPITIVPNGIRQPSTKRERTNSIKTLGCVGRIEFSQKQQDFLITAFQSLEDFRGLELRIVGSGPDENRARAMSAASEHIALIPWQQDMEAVYDHLDLLVIPSRYEGVPLVMLEALARGIPVIGSARDGMKDLLPEEWTFEPGKKESLATAFNNVRKTGAQEIGMLQQKVLAEHSLELFKTNFAEAVTGQ